VSIQAVQNTLEPFTSCSGNAANIVLFSMMPSFPVHFFKQASVAIGLSPKQNQYNMQHLSV
jgi:hypothetical protein